MNLSQKECSHCGEVGNKFYASYPTKCAPCIVKASAAWQEKNKDKTRGYRLKSQYGISSERFDEILESQDGRCGICARTEPTGSGAWHVDHDHICCPGKKSCGGCVRGLLCNRCNAGLGMFGDDVDTLMSGVAYLVKWGGQN